MQPARSSSDGPHLSRVRPSTFEGVVEELATMPDVERAFLALAERPHCIFFDSARQQSELGRYSFLAADPFDFVCLSVAEAIDLGTTEESVF